MEDKDIIELYWNRKVSAVSATIEKYHKYCYHIAVAILGNAEDAGECVNDTWLKAWNAIPPGRPENLAAFLGKLTRNTAIDCLRKRTRKRRGGNGADLMLDELEECLPDAENVEKELEARELSRLINDFLGTLTEFERNVFVCRYWYLEPVHSIAKAAHASVSRIKSILFRTRKKLKAYLKEEGYDVEQ